MWINFMNHLSIINSYLNSHIQFNGNMYTQMVSVMYTGICSALSLRWPSLPNMVNLLLQRIDISLIVLHDKPKIWTHYDFWIVIFCKPQWRYSESEDICFPLIVIVLQQSTQSSFIKLLHHCRLWAPALQRCSSRELFYDSSGQESSSTLFQSFNQLAPTSLSLPLCIQFCPYMYTPLEKPAINFFL